MRRLPLLAACALALAACTAPPTGEGSGGADSRGDSFFEGTPQPVAVERAEWPAPSEAAHRAAVARIDEARSANATFNGGEWAELYTGGAGAGREGRKLSVGRDSLGRIRRATVSALGARGQTMTVSQHWFGPEGQTVGFTHIHNAFLPDTCAPSVSARVLDLWLDGGALVSAAYRNDPPAAPCTPPYPSGLTALVYPDLAGVLAAEGIADPGTLPWGTRVPTPGLR